MDNFERDDAFFSVVNKNSRAVDEDINIQKNIAWNVNSFSKQIAMAEKREKMLSEHKRTIERKKNIRMMAVAGALVAVLASGMTAGIVYADDINTAITERNELNDAISILTRNANILLSIRGLTDGFHNNSNTIDDYKSLHVNSIKNVYIYKYASAISGYGSRSEREFDKLIKTVSYNSEDGSTLFYSSFDDFLKVNGFANEREFKEEAQKIIRSEYKSGKIQPIAFEGFATVNTLPRGVTK